MPSKKSEADEKSAAAKNKEMANTHNNFLKKRSSQLDMTKKKQAPKMTKNTSQKSLRTEPVGTESRNRAGSEMGQAAGDVSSQCTRSDVRGSYGNFSSHITTVQIGAPGTMSFSQQSRPTNEDAHQRYPQVKLDRSAKPQIASSQYKLERRERRGQNSPRAFLQPVLKPSEDGAVDPADLPINMKVLNTMKKAQAKDSLAPLSLPNPGTALKSKPLADNRVNQPPQFSQYALTSQSVFQNLK